MQKKIQCESSLNKEYCNIEEEKKNYNVRLNIYYKTYIHRIYVYMYIEKKKKRVRERLKIVKESKI